MTKKEFVRFCSKFGYSHAWNTELFCKEYPKEEYSEEDAIKAYRYEGVIENYTTASRTTFGDHYDED